MDYTHRIICVIFLFIILSVLGFRYKQKKAIRQRIERVQLYEDAQKYFVTICYKLLTPFGDEESMREYITFRIYGEQFLVLKIIIEDQSEREMQILMSIQFKGKTLLDQWSKKEYSYSAFERHLNTFVGDSLVYDFYIKHLWNEMKKKESVQ